jgi:hypothetical protein
LHRIDCIVTSESNPKSSSDFRGRATWAPECTKTVRPSTHENRTAPGTNLRDTSVARGIEGGRSRSEFIACPTCAIRNGVSTEVARTHPQGTVLGQGCPDTGGQGILYSSSCNLTSTAELLLPTSTSDIQESLSGRAALGAMTLMGALVALAFWEAFAQFHGIEEANGRAPAAAFLPPAFPQEPVSLIAAAPHQDSNREASQQALRLTAGGSCFRRGVSGLGRFCARGGTRLRARGRGRFGSVFFGFDDPGAFFDGQELVGFDVGEFFDLLGGGPLHFD